MGFYMGFQTQDEGEKLRATITSPAVFSILSKIIHYSAFSAQGRGENSKQSDPTSSPRNRSGLKWMACLQPITRGQPESLTFGITTLVM
jgi:hypothetical protein